MEGRRQIHKSHAEAAETLDRLHTYRYVGVLGWDEAERTMMSSVAKAEVDELQCEQRESFQKRACTVINVLFHIGTINAGPLFSVRKHTVHIFGLSTLNQYSTAFLSCLVFLSICYLCVCLSLTHTK